MGKVKSASAILFAAMFLILASGCSKENNNIDFGEPTQLTQVSGDIPEPTQVTEETSQLMLGEPVIGGDAILSQDTLDDFTANLIIRDISQLPDGSEEGNDYCGKFIVVELKDNKSGVTVENILPENPYIMRNDNMEIDGLMRISAECATDSVEILCIDNKGKKEYILKVEYVQGPDRRIAAFACCDMSRYEGSGKYLKWYKINGSDYECRVSPYFAYKGGNKFTDSLTELEYEFDNENLLVKVSDMDRSDIVFGEPQVGKNSILSQSSLGNYSAAVEAHNIFCLPEDEDSDLGRMYEAEEISLNLFVNDELIAYGGLNNALVGAGSDFRAHFSIPEKCTGDGATQIFQVEQRGKTHYIVMQYCMYDKESDTIGASFACFDPEVYEKYKESSKEAVFPLIWYDIKYSGLSENVFGNYNIQISDAFEYVSEGVFCDSVYGYEISFDCEALSAKAYPIQ